MWILITLIITITIFYLIGKQPARLLQRGKLVRSQHIEREGKIFYIEEVSFSDYHQALHHYFYLIPQFSDRKNLLETQYSYLDWTDTTLRFSDYTLQLVRRVNHILLIKSQTPMSIAEFERLTQGI
ncbi:hypothetical protein [Rodentibacter trehalosifermentans]|uniref:hypothetical protein n=1 Tax=Rodentibacter trehalosifermentans TaxID=1908263 RepID=UPI000985EB2D|nr:hypothetical protein [Rodentibacter trehalosifermentans]OOF52642.1 hypothetical protein BKK53_04075 [Rodentibacter trehalosifermentans]